MRWDVTTWAVLALALIAAETLAPGAFLLWMGFAAAAMLLLVLLLPGLPLLAQVALFVVLSFLSIQVYRRWFRGRGRQGDRPLCAGRAEQGIGPVAPLEPASGTGGRRTTGGDALCTVEGPHLPPGALVRVLAAAGGILKVQAA